MKIDLNAPVGIGIKIVAAMTGLAILLFVVSLAFAPRSMVHTVASIAEPAPEVKHAPTVEIAPAKVRAYAPKVKKELGLPPSAAGNPSIYALGATRVEPDFHPVTISTTINEQTGEVTMYEKREPLPWVAPTLRGEAGIAYGVRSDGTMGGRLFVNQGLLDIKSVRMGATATLDQDGTAFAGLSLSYRW